MLSQRAVSVGLMSLVLLHPLSIAAQQADPFREVLEVGLTNVDVTATDRSGNPVSGLKREDFEIYEDGKRQEITHFSEVGSEEAAAATTTTTAAAEAAPQELAPSPVPRKFIFYIDDATLTIENRRAVFPAIRKFLATHFRPDDRAMLATWNRALTVRVPWTGDATAIDEALSVLAAELPSSADAQGATQQAQTLLRRMADQGATQGNNLTSIRWADLESSARSYAETRKSDITLSTNALVRLLGSLTGVDGKKVLVIATDSLPTIAGAEVFAHLENLRTSLVMSSTSGFNQARMGSQITNLSRYDLTPVLETLIRAANATGVTVYGINPKGLTDAAKVEDQTPRELNVQFAKNVQTLSGINMLASRTGGVAMVGAPADTALDRIGHDLNRYYSLGYRATPGASPERRIEVRSKRRGVNVRARTSIYYRSLEREMVDRVIANQLQSELTNDLDIALQAEPAASDGNQRLLAVRVTIPMDLLTLLPDGKGNVTGGLSVFSCSGDGAGAASKVNVQSKALRLTAEQVAQMKGQRISFILQVPIEKDRRQVSVGVVDHTSQTQGFATLKAAS